MSKITPKGWINVNGYLFNATTGNCRGYGDVSLKEATPDIIKRDHEKKLNEERFIADTLTLIHEWESLTYNDATNVRKALGIRPFDLYMDNI